MDTFSAKTFSLDRFQTAEALRQYISNNFPNKQNFEKCNVLSLHAVHLDWTFLEVLIGRWDTGRLGFRFGNNLMCPTLEEVSQITGLRMETDSKMILPVETSDRVRLIERFMGLKSAEQYAGVHRIQETVETSFLVHLLVRSGPTALKDEHKKNILDLALVGELLFPSRRPHRVSVSLSLVIEQMRDNSATVVPLLLGELLMSVHGCATRLSNVLRGPVAVLQIWALEHYNRSIDLSNVFPTTNNDIPWDFYNLQNTGQTKTKTLKEWVNIFASNNMSITWHCPWLKRPDIVRVRASDANTITLPGLKGSICYAPIQCPRLLGYELRNPLELVLEPQYFPVTYTAEKVSWFNREWKNTENVPASLGLVLWDQQSARDVRNPFVGEGPTERLKDKQKITKLNLEILRLHESAGEHQLELERVCELNNQNDAKLATMEGLLHEMRLKQTATEKELNIRNKERDVAVAQRDRAIRQRDRAIRQRDMAQKSVCETERWYKSHIKEKKIKFTEQWNNLVKWGDWLFAFAMNMQAQFEEWGLHPPYPEDDREPQFGFAPKAETWRETYDMDGDGYPEPVE